MEADTEMQIQSLEEMWTYRHAVQEARIEGMDSRVRALESNRVDADLTMALLGKDLTHMKDTIDNMSALLTKHVGESGQNLTVAKRAVITGISAAIGGGIVSAVVWIAVQMYS